MATTSFLLEATTTLPDADNIAAHLIGKQQEEDDNCNDEDHAVSVSVRPAATTNVKAKRVNVDLVNSRHNGEETSSSSAAAAAAAVAVVNTKGEVDTSCNNDNNNNDNDQHHFLLGQPLHSEPIELSLINPRGKFYLTIHPQGWMFRTVGVKKNNNSTTFSSSSFVIPKTGGRKIVRNIVIFPKPTDCQFVSSETKKATMTPMVLICFQNNNNNNDDDDDDDDNAPRVTFKDKRLDQICFALPTIPPPPAAVLSDGSLKQSIATTTAAAATAAEEESSNNKRSVSEASWIRLVSQSLDVPTTHIYRIQNPNLTSHDDNFQQPTKNCRHWTFRSFQQANTSSTAGNLPFVKTYYGVQDGCLFPMEEGLLFFK